jgi:pentatricopeptide repeat protein
MLQSLRFITRQGEHCRRHVWSQKQVLRAFVTPAIIKNAAPTRLHVPATRRNHSSAAANISNNRPVHKKLPSNAVAFLEELQAFAWSDGSTDSDAATLDSAKLKRRIQRLYKHPDACRLILRKSLHFEKKNPQYRGLLVDSDCFFFVIKSCVDHGQVERAHELLRLCQQQSQSPEQSHLKPHRNFFGLVMTGYAKQRTLQGLNRVEQMLGALEKEHLQAAASSTKSPQPPLDCCMYNILMNAYIGVLKKNSVDAIRKKLDHMEYMAQRFDDDSLRPNAACYTSLMKALIRRRQPGFALEVNEMLDKLKRDKRLLEHQSAEDRIYLDIMAMHAWSKSDDPKAPIRARQIFDNIEKPNSLAYNVLCSIYTGIGDFDEVLSLYQEMQINFDFGRNTNCPPDLHTYGTVLNALKKSSRADAVDKAEKISNAIAAHTTATYTAMITIYAKNGHIKKALDLFYHMRREFKSGKNEKCVPSMNTYNTILKAIQKSTIGDAFARAEHIFSTISYPNTVVYNTYMSIFAQRGQLDTALTIVERMQSDFDSGINKHCQPGMHTYNILHDALQLSKRPDAVEKAEQLLASIQSPNTGAYTTLIRKATENGQHERALLIFTQMLSDYDSDQNKNCRPDVHTCCAILDALGKSNRSDAVEIAEQVFDSIPMMNKTAYDTLLNMYADRGMAHEALSLIGRMQYEYDSGENPTCKPGNATKRNLKRALRLTNSPTLTSEEKDVIKWFFYQRKKAGGANKFNMSELFCF